MASEAPVGEPQRRRTGRPPKIDRDTIARAVIEIGFDSVTMKRVAEHLDVSVPGLYYYVRGRDDLQRLAAEYSMAHQPLPQDTGQHWATWLREWARYMRTSMTEPELLEHYITGDLNAARILEVLSPALDVLCREGFAPVAAMAAWNAVSSVALGSAVGDLREHEATIAGRPWLAQAHALLARSEADEHPTLRALLAAPEQADADASFERRLTMMVIGLAMHNDLPLDAEVLGEEAKPPARRKAKR